MQSTITRLEDLLKASIEPISHDINIKKGWKHKSSPEKWSKQEILGHLIDSAINNLQRFTEIQFEPKPYQIRRYNQDELVKANAYQEAEINKLIALWLSVNIRILALMKLQTEATLSYPIILPDGEASDLRFLMTDYVDHLEHHLKQLKEQ